jgi:hypothetical protein
MIGAEGDLKAALAEFNIAHNATRKPRLWIFRLAAKVKNMIKKR